MLPRLLQFAIAAVPASLALALAGWQQPDDPRLLALAAFAMPRSMAA
jgi:hypothetical protein